MYEDGVAIIRNHPDNVHYEQRGYHFSRVFVTLVFSVRGNPIVGSGTTRLAVRIINVRCTTAGSVPPCTCSWNSAYVYQIIKSTMISQVMDPERSTFFEQLTF